jgi:hypothetical protein
VVVEVDRRLRLAGQRVQQRLGPKVLMDVESGAYLRRKPVQ